FVGAARLVGSHSRRRHGSHVEPVSGRVRGALRAGRRVLPDRAVHLPPHGDAAATLVARLHPEREVALAWCARRTVSALRRRGGVVGCHGRCCGVSGRPTGPRPPAGEPLGPVGLCDRRPGRPGSCARGCRPAARGRTGPGEHSGVLPAPHGQRGFLPACRIRRAAPGSPSAALQKGTLTVTAGLPGTGIGGIFYLASALVMPFREVSRRLRGRPAGNRRVVAAQLAIAGGILGAMWVTGRLLGLALAAARPIARLGTSLPPSNVLLIASVTLALGTLVGVLVGVELLRLLVHRGTRSPLRGKAMPAGRAEPHVGQERRRVAMLLMLGLVVPDPHGALAQSPGRVAALLARADSAWAAKAESVAASEYAAVLAADPENSHATYRLAQLTRNDPAAALRLFQRYVVLEPEDPWGYMAVADALAQAGRYPEALQSYDDALRLAPGEPEAVAGRAKVFPRARVAAPAVTPLVSGSRDSDGNTTFRVGGIADLAVPGALRLVVEAIRDRVTYGVDTSWLEQLALRAAWRPGRLASVEGALGGTRLEPSDNGSTTVVPTGRLRARWRSSAHGAAVDVRAQRGVLAASPLLVDNRLVRTEVRTVVEIPVTRALKLRGLGRTAVLSDRADVNHRTELGLVLALPLS